MATWPTITDDDGSNTTGTIVNNASVWNPIRDYIGEAWTSPSFNAANFTGSGTITWTVASGDVALHKYVVIGKTMHVHLNLITTTVAGTGTGLRVALPGGVSLIGASRGVYWYSDNGTEGFGGYIVNASYIEFFKSSSASNWNASTNNTAIYASVTFEIA